MGKDKADKDKEGARPYIKDKQDVIELDGNHIGFFGKVTKQTVTKLIQMASKLIHKQLEQHHMNEFKEHGYGGCCSSSEGDDDSNASSSTISSKGSKGSRQGSKQGKDMQGSQGRPKLYIHVDSPGGCLHSGLRAYDYIRRLSKRITIVTVAEGCVASAATLITLAGTQRLATKNTTFLYHQLSSGVYGKYQDITDEKHACDMLMNKLYKIYKRHSNMSEEKIVALLGREKLLSAKKCIKMGMVDGYFD